MPQIFAFPILWFWNNTFDNFKMFHVLPLVLNISMFINQLFHTTVINIAKSMSSILIYLKRNIGKISI